MEGKRVVNWQVSGKEDRKTIGMFNTSGQEDNSKIGQN